MEDNLLLLTRQALGDDFPRLVGNLFGESEGSMQSTLAALLPVAIGDIARQGTTLEGAQMLLSNLEAAAIDPGVLNDIHGIFGHHGTAASALMKAGASLAPNIFGDQGRRLVAALTSVSRLRAPCVTNLVTLVVPLTLCVLQRLAADHRLDARGLASVLGRQGPHLERSLDPRVVAAIGYASPATFVEGIGGPASRDAPPYEAAMPPAGGGMISLAKNSGVPSLLPWIALAIGLVLVPVLWRSCAMP